MEKDIDRHGTCCMIGYCLTLLGFLEMEGGRKITRGSTSLRYVWAIYPLSVIISCKRLQWIFANSIEGQDRFPLILSRFCFSHHVLQISGGIHQAGEVRFELAMCLLLGWIIVYFCVWKGIKSAGKVLALIIAKKYFWVLLSCITLSVVVGNPLLISCLSFMVILFVCLVFLFFVFLLAKMVRFK